MLTVFKREWRSLFTSFRGYTFVGVFFALTLVVRMLYHYVVLYEKFSGYTNIEYALTYLPIAFILAAPVLTLGLFAELTNKGTKDFLRSLPLSKMDIVMGKLLTVFSVFLASYGIVELISLVIGLYGKGNASTRLVFILFYILACTAMLSIFCFVSVVLKNKWMALGVNYGIAILCSLFCIFRDDMPNVLESILEPFSIIGSFNNAVYGVVDLASIILWVSVIVVFGTLTCIFFNKEFDD